MELPSGGIDIAAVIGIFSLLKLFFNRNCNMKVSASVKSRCAKCKSVRRRGVVYIICENPRHKARQGTKQRKSAA